MQMEIGLIHRSKYSNWTYKSNLFTKGTYEETEKNESTKGVELLVYPPALKGTKIDGDFRVIILFSPW